MILERLKSETSTLHDKVEEAMDSGKIMNPDYSKEDYILLLQKLWLAHQAIEPSILSFPEIRNNEKLQAYVRFNKRPLLEKDLEELGSRPPSYTGKPAELLSLYEALGAAYVLEGSTLGGSVILKQLRKNDWNFPVSFRYYDCYGGSIGKMWMQFKNIMEEWVTSDEAMVSQVLSGARKAYSQFLSRHESMA